VRQAVNEQTNARLTRDCKADEGLSQHPVRRRKTTTGGIVTKLNERPLTTHARELQKGCYCRSVSAIHQGSPLTLDFKAAFKEWFTVFGHRELHVSKYWSPDTQLEAVKQRLRHLIAARRYSNGKRLYLGIWQHFKYFCSIFQGVSFNYHQRNVGSRSRAFRSRLLWQSLGLEVSARSRSFSQVSVSEVTVSTTTLVFSQCRNRIWMDIGY